MIEKRNYKYNLPDGRKIDIISDVVISLLEYQQRSIDIPESGGFLLGYLNKKTENETISSITRPQFGDIQKRYFCTIRSAHYNLLQREFPKGNFFMGVWHTHPQDYPNPSCIDWDDWYKTLQTSYSNYRYVYFLIIGTEHMRIWAGDLHSKDKIVELAECERLNNLYSY